MPAKSLPPFSGLGRTQLSEHLRQCAQCSGVSHRVACAAESIHHFLAQRFVTTLAVVTMLALAGAWCLF